jgi:hypothetical protein
MAENKDSEKGEGEQEKTTPEDPTIPKKPKHIFRKNQKNDPSRSKSAPAEEFSNETDENDDYIGSYNYFIYYNSIKPKNPHLPKPTYKPKPNLDFIKESKPKDEEDEETPERNENININPLENLTKEINHLNLEQNPNQNQLMNNNQDILNQNIFNEDFMNNFPKNQNKKNFNSAEDVPSPLEYYTNLSNQQNEIAQQQMWKDQNLGMGGMGLGMYNPGMAPIGGMVGMGMNPINPLIGMNMGMNPYSNLPQYGNMMGMNPSLMNANYRMLAGNGQFNRGKKAPMQKKGNNRPQEGMDNMALQNQMLNMYNNQAYNGFPFPQNNPMMGMNMNMNYLNDQRFPMMQMDQAYLRNNLMQGDMNNYDFYQNLNNTNANKMHSKKNKKGENFVRKEVSEYKNIEEIIDKAVVLSKDHSGSRLVQRKYEEGNEEIRSKIFEKFKPEILNLSKDIFGNYAIQKVLEFKDREKNNFIMESLQGKIYELSLHMYGCRVMQQLISVIDEKYLPQITLELKDHFEKCIEDQNGNHVIQKLIERLKPGENNGIYDVVYENIVDLSKHQYGCRVIQTLLKKCNEEQVAKMLQKIYNDVKELSEDQYGNYIIQYILENQKGKNVESIYEGLKGHIYDFSIHKYASNVVERALTFGDEKQRQNIINEIIKQDDQMKECLLSMVKDKFGNYVVQKIIEFSDPEMRKNIINRIISSQSLKKKDGFSKHVINFIEKLNSQNGGINLDLTPSTGKEKNEGSKNLNKKEF